VVGRRVLGAAAADIPVASSRAAVDTQAARVVERRLLANLPDSEAVGSFVGAQVVSAAAETRAGVDTLAGLAVARVAVPGVAVARVADGVGVAAGRTAEQTPLERSAARGRMCAHVRLCAPAPEGTESLQSCRLRWGWCRCRCSVEQTAGESSSGVAT